MVGNIPHENGTMKTTICTCAALLALSINSHVLGEVPHVISYQGKITVAGKPFNATGWFKFALVDANGINLWTNDGTNVGNANPPSAAAALAVDSGIYSVMLGDAAAGMQPIDPAIFVNNANVELRTWFNDGSHGLQHLTPDYALGSVPYAMVAAALPCDTIQPCNLNAGTVRGQVADCIGGGGVEDAVVYAEGASSVSFVTSAAPHQYELKYVPAGTREIVARFPSGAKMSITVDVASGAVLAGVDFALGGVMLRRDADGDGFGDPANITYSCGDLPGYVSNGDDCDDSAAAIGAPAACSVPGGTGYCSQGWQCPGKPCVALQPRPEICNDIDDDCDGVTDEDAIDGAAYYRDADADGYGDPSDVVFACRAPRDYTDNGIDCDDGNPRVHPDANEICNGIDDDCDGMTDEAFPVGTPCSIGMGICTASGVLVCSPGGGVVCAAEPGLPLPEVCNGLDDDCDGTTDEDIASEPCYVGIGICARQGMIVCANSALSCDAVPGEPQLEACNGLDDDCDGVTDEGADASCNDGNACTVDACVSGACSHVPVNCDDGNPNTTDYCDPYNGCMHLPH